jgi:hypothetical protein
VQIPVPGGGPVSLIPGAGGKPAAAPSHQADESAIHKGQDAGGAARQDGKQEAAAVAALAGRLARSAVGVMEASELASAQQVDFEHLDAERRADVSEKLADAIERENTARGAPALPSLLDEVFQHNFVREPELPEENEADYEEALFEPVQEASEAPAALAPQERELERQEPPHAEEPEAIAAPEPPQPPEEKSVQLTVEAAAPKPPAAPPPAAPQTQTQIQPIAQAQVPPLAQVQFAGMVQPSVSAKASSGLEDAVREMLRPLLVQWLNENMPRILENAIREEIALRGLLPKSDS